MEKWTREKDIDKDTIEWMDRWMDGAENFFFFSSVEIVVFTKSSLLYVHCSSGFVFIFFAVFGLCRLRWVLFIL